MGILAACRTFTRLRRVAAGKSESESEISLKGLFLYTVGILCDVERCIIQLWCFSTTLYNITSIAYNHQTDIYPILNIYTFTMQPGRRL